MPFLTQERGGGQNNRGWYYEPAIGIPICNHLHKVILFR